MTQKPIRTAWEGERKMLSRGTCSQCQGAGELESGDTCDCVWMRVFHDVWQRYEELSCSDRRASSLYMHSVYGVSRPTEEFVADVEILSKRTLAGYPELYKVWKVCIFGPNSPKLFRRISGLSLHSIYEDIAKCKVLLGRVFQTTQPYPLFPLDSYFRTHHTADVRSRLVARPTKFQPVRPPVRPNPLKERAA